MEVHIYILDNLASHRTQNLLKKKYLNRLILKYMDSNFLSLESSSINLLLDPSVPRPIHMYD
jgi:hypothetical protein